MSIKEKIEIWKNIRGFECLYQVSNFGRVKRLKRIIKTKRWIKKVGRNYIEELILKPIKKSIGYIQYNLYKNGKNNICLGHRLVAKNFIPNPQKKLQINHKDGDGFNNNIKNLEWCTASENGLHAYRVLKNKAWSKGIIGEKAPTSRPVLQKTLNGKFVKRWGCGLDAVRDGGFESSCISRCCSGKQKTHKNYFWEYEK